MPSPMLRLYYGMDLESKYGRRSCDTYPATSVDVVLVPRIQILDGRCPWTMSV